MLEDNKPNTEPRVKFLFWVVGDPSADFHCARVIQEIRSLAPHVENVGLGGPQMAKAGLTLLCDLCSNAIMGFAEVITHLSKIKKLLSQTERWISEYNPIGIVLVDYPGFNLHLASKVKQLGIPIIYYISPQVWAWKKNRVKRIAELVKKMLVIFPFEVDIYKSVGVDCEYVGHPLIDRIPEIRKPLAYSPPYNIALLPGSRIQEIKRILPVMIETAKKFKKEYPDTHFFSSSANQQCYNVIREVAKDLELTILQENIEGVLSIAHAGLVASGTATLESALYGMPYLLVYKTHPLTYIIARFLVDIKYIGIVNIIMNQQVVPEYIQKDAYPPLLFEGLKRIIEDSKFRESILENFQKLRGELGLPGACKKTAVEILKTLGELSTV
ncbi:MAG: lipid-A-disaccharide synthase [Candidatus Hydrogenedentes bacterium]|nr:lipid-A-disaccharide synthase [Candidatus Hydrogenedentota bacterium]